MSKIGIAPPEPARPIAIIGMSCRLPGANSIVEFWELLLREENQVCDVPAERFDVGTWHHPQPRTPGRMSSRRGSFIDDIAGFDADYFDISAHEAVRMHPQQRVLLETAHDAIEDAGIPLDQLAGTSTGVYVASLSTSEYWDLLREAGMLDLHAFLGTGPIGTLAGRLAHALDLRGPNLAVDATCASGLLAVHLACQSLRTGDAEFALAAGVSLVLTPDISIALSQSGVLSPAGISRFGDATSDGYGRGEGVAAVLLKPLDRALTDGDPVRAVILGSAMTSNGRAKAHMAAPCGDGQSEALRRAYLAAGIAPGDVDYVEAHGTGTVAGDRVELSALAQVLRQGRRPGQPCVVGSVKSNVGHTEPTAGLVGLLKTALSLQHGWIPRTLHVDTPNPVLDTAGSVLRLARTAQAWPRRAHHPGLAGVSCLGATGSNTHAVLSTPPEPRIGDNRCTGPLTLPLSARKPEALTELARRYLRFLEAEQHTGRLRDVCYTAGAH
ncbi:MAG: beta-ketoacyl synthase N-terminal-like domain-containing protein, partial [Pseudonocardiaceae bacterium]